MSKLREALIVLLLCFVFGCQIENKDESAFSKVEKSPFNIFNMKRTSFLYRGGRIYTIDIPHPFLFSAFSKSNYLLVRDDKIQILTMYENCINDYKTGKYKIKNSLEGSIEDYNECDINLVPFLDFSLRVKNKSVHFNDHWVRLDKKFFDNNLNDTIYKFRRQWRERERQTIIFASKELGIVGAVDTLVNSKSTIALQYTMGRIYNKVMVKEQPFKLKGPSLNLNYIKEFEKDDY